MRTWVAGVELYRSRPLQTGQTTVYAARDDADILAGIAKRYGILTTGSQSGTTAIYLPAYAANTISFDAASKEVRDSANGMATFKTGDVIRIRGSSANDASGTGGNLTVATGNVAEKAVVSEAISDEAAGAWITIAKQALHSNNVVEDLQTKLTWLRDPSSTPTKLGAASDGKLLWTATAISLHAANNDLKVTTGGKGRATFTIIGGAAELPRYWAGYSYSFTVFANANAKLPGFRCISVAVNVADLDILMDTGNITVATEAGPINGAISLSCNGIFGFCNAANAAGLAGYSDWRVPNVSEQYNLLSSVAASGAPDATAFPNWTDSVATSTSSPGSATTACQVITAATALISNGAKTTARYLMLVRGGV